MKFVIRSVLLLAIPFTVLFGMTRAHADTIASRTIDVDGIKLHYFTAGNVHNQASLSLVDRDLTARLNKESGMEIPTPPVVFFKLPTAIIGPGVPSPW